MTTTALPSRLTFSTTDLDWLAALLLTPDAEGWRIPLDHDDDHDLLSVQPPFAAEASFLIVPTLTGGVLMSSKADGWRSEVAFPSLRDALLSVGPCGADWGGLPA